MINKIHRLVCIPTSIAPYNPERSPIRLAKRIAVLSYRLPIHSWVNRSKYRTKSLASGDTDCNMVVIGRTNVIETLLSHACGTLSSIELLSTTGVAKHFARCVTHALSTGRQHRVTGWSLEFDTPGAGFLCINTLNRLEPLMWFCYLSYSSNGPGVIGLHVEIVFLYNTCTVSISPTYSTYFINYLTDGDMFQKPAKCYRIYFSVSEKIPTAWSQGCFGE